MKSALFTATKFELHLPSIILHALNLWFNSLSFNASSLSCLIKNSEKRVWKTDNPTHCASADHINHINFGIRLPFTFALDSMQVLGARGLCHLLHNRVGTEQWHPILPSRGAQYHRERDFWSLFICPARYWASFFIFTWLIIIWPNVKSSAFFKSRREILDGHFVTLVKQG